MDGAIAAKHVTYDFARLMEGATEVAHVGVRRHDHREHVDEFRKLRSMNSKVTVVGGAGNVGATVARAIADKELADVVIIDIADQKAGGIALDMFEACPIEGSDSRVVGYGANEEGWAQTADSDVVVITSGVPRKPGMSRDDLLNVNYKIMQSVTEQIVKHSPEHDHRAGRQSARRHVPGGLPAERFPARARHRHGRRARLGPHARVHRDGDRGLGREHPRVRARRPRRHDGAAAALLDDRRDPACPIIPG